MKDHSKCNTNEDRAERAFRALLAWRGQDAADDLETQLVDFIADVLHLADETGDEVDLLDVMRRSQDHYEAEAGAVRLGHCPGCEA